MNKNTKTMQINPIGSRFINEDKRLPAVELIVVPQRGNAPYCDGCFYKKSIIRDCNLHACTPLFRPDKKHVIFKKYESQK